MSLPRSEENKKLCKRWEGFIQGEMDYTYLVLAEGAESFLSLLMAVSLG